MDSKPQVQWRESVSRSGQWSLLYTDGQLWGQGPGFAVVELDDKTSVSTATSTTQPLAVWTDTLYFRKVEKGDTVAVKKGEIRSGGGAGDSPTSTPTPSQESGLKWRINKEALIGKRVGDEFYMLTRGGEFVVVDAETGTKHWTYVPDSDVLSFIVTSMNVILQGDKKVVAVDRANGTHQWELTPTPKQLVQALDLKKWQRDLIDNQGLPSITFGDVSLGGGLLLMTEYNSRLGIHAVTARNPLTGELKWARNSVTTQTVQTVTDNYIASPYGAFQLSSQTSAWRIGQNPPFGVKPPISAIATQQYVLVTAPQKDNQQQSVLVALSITDGSVAWKLPIKGRIWYGGCIAVNDAIYVMTESGTVLKLT